MTEQDEKESKQEVNHKPCSSEDVKYYKNVRFVKVILDICNQIFV